MKKTFIFLFTVMLSLCSYAQVLRGDVDGDGKISMNDVALLVDMYLNPSKGNTIGGNTGGGEVTVGDLTLVSGEATAISPTSVNLSGRIDGLEKLKKGTYGCGYVYGKEPQPSPSNGVYKAVTPVNGILSLDINNLTNDTQYYFRVVVVTNNNEVFYGETGEFYMSDVITPGTVIDLGLSVRWASCNLGASSPVEKGDLYAWGETNSKETFTKNNYKYYNSMFDTYYDIGSLISGNSEFDPVAAIYGDDWHMPNKDEMAELKDLCKWEDITYRSVLGKRVTGPNGNSIFIPKANYWEGSKYGDDGTASRLVLDGRVVSYASYSTGHYIRPVKGHYFKYVCGNTAQINVSGLPTESKAGFYVGDVNDPNASNSKFATAVLNDDGTFCLDYSGSDNYNFNPVIISANNGSLFGEKHGRSVHYVDLGLSVKWATCNLGAGSPEDYGDSFVWGETTPKAYSSSDYFDNSFQKYNMDTKTILEKEDDAASVNLGDKWRMPTNAEINELISKCYWRWTTNYNGKNVEGYIVYKAKAVEDMGQYRSSYITPLTYSLADDPHIFLPVTNSNYWSNSLGSNKIAYRMLIRKDQRSVSYNDERYKLNSIRPVCP